MNITNIKIITSIQLFFVTSNCFPQWIQQGVGANEVGYGIHYSIVTDPQTVWAIGMSLQTPTLQSVRTLDGGNSWILNILPDVYQGSGIRFFIANDANHAWIYYKNITANHYNFKRTVDGGQSWTLLDSLLVDSVSVNRMWFTDSTTGYFIAPIPKQLYQTLNGGVSWQIMPGTNFHGLFQGSETPGALLHPEYYIPGIPLNILTNKGKLLISWDNGILWQTRNTPFSGQNVNIPHSVFTSSSHGYIWDNSEHFAETTNGGITWDSYTAEGCYNCLQLENLKWVPGTYGTFVYGSHFSVDGGRHWELFSGVDSIGWRDFFWANNTTGWLAYATYGPNPAQTGLFKYNGILLNTEDPQALKDEFGLYPIPSQGLLTYVVSAGLKPDALLLVKNTLGQVVFEQKLSKNSGGSEMILDLSSQPKGVYFASLYNGGSMICKKILLE